MFGCLVLSLAVSLVGCKKPAGEPMEASSDVVCKEANLGKNIAVTGYPGKIERMSGDSYVFDLSMGLGATPDVEVLVTKALGKPNTATIRDPNYIDKPVESFILDDGTTVLNNGELKLTMHGKVGGSPSKGEWCYVTVYRIEAAK